MFYRNSIVAVLLPALAGGLIACGGEEGNGENPPPVPPRELRTPELRQVAPTDIAVGQTMSIFGSGFEDGKVGVSRLYFEGTFQTSAGRSYPVKMEVTPSYSNQGVLTWTFGPNVAFMPASAEQDTGVFRGVVRVKNLGLDGKVKGGANASRSEQIQVKPSIIIKSMRPRDMGCAPGITDTTADTKFLFEMQAIGLKAGAQGAPLRFVYTFMKQHFQFRGYFANQVGMDPEGLFPKSGPTSVVDDVTNGTVSKLGTGAPRNIYVNQGGYTPSLAGMTFGADKTFGLTDLYTASVPGLTSDYFTANMNIVAVDRAGQSAARSIQLKVWNPIEVTYKGGSTVVQTYDPVPVSGCLDGGDVGRKVTYTEQQSEERSRGYKVISKVSGGFDIKVVRLSAEFGIEVDSTVTSSKSKSLQFSGDLLPKQVGVFYRQTTKMERRGTLTGHDGCGNTQDLGEVVVTDWSWSPDLAKGKPPCPPLPPSNLGKGKTFTK